jgi:hypothetical protein
MSDTSSGSTEAVVEEVGICSRNNVFHGRTSQSAGPNSLILEAEPAFTREKAAVWLPPGVTASTVKP